VKVVLAGYNIESEGVRLLNRLSSQHFTPEIISAAYARISRDPRSVDTLRGEARRRVEEARASNKKIVFEMGHSSIAEHAVFNFDITNISRLAVEEIEHFRLASFTEKSQRYIRLGKDIVVPEEMKSEGLEETFRSVMQELHESYETLYGRILESGEAKVVAREDARYVMPLATSAQLGMTLNARELEYMIARLAAHPIAELRALSSKLYGSVEKIAPSLVRYPEATRYFTDVHEIKEGIAESLAKKARRAGDKKASARLLGVTQKGEVRLAAALLFTALDVTFSEAMECAGEMSAAERFELITKTMRHMQPYDSAWREFENVHLCFEIVASASCFAQLKRHRMATILTQPYNVSLGVSVPPSIKKAKAVGLFRAAVKRSERFHRLISGRTGDAAVYALTNSHRRRILMDINLRELYHFSRLRSDRHAQWEIRRLSDAMCEKTARRLPAAAALMCGKDRFHDTKRTVLTEKTL
jgi:flavin-dependent thymidylate synthase